MKTTPLDFLLAGTFLCALAAAALGLVAGAVAPHSPSWFGSYSPLADVLAALLSFGLLSAFACRVLLAIRPLAAGRFGMDESLFTYWKLLTVLYEFGRGALLPFTTVFARPLVAAMFGARVGRQTAFGGRIADPSLVEVGEGAVLGHNSVLTPHAIVSGAIVLHPIRIGARATIGVNVVVNAGVEVGDRSVVAAGSVLPPFTRIPPDELWGGIPVRRIKSLESDDVRG